MSKKTFYKIVSLLICVLLVIPALASCFQNRDGAPALWRVSDGDGNVMYVMGSIHIGEESMYPFDDRVLNAFDECDYLAVEYDVIASEKASENMTPQENLEYLSQFMYKNGETIKDHLSEQTYSAAVSYLKECGMYSEQMDLLVPAFWSSMISSLVTEQSGYLTDYGVDRTFINMANESGKGILEVESEEKQLELMLSFDDIVYDDSISEILSLREQVGMQYAYMIDLWKRGREDLLDTLTNGTTALFSGDEDSDYAKAYEEYNKAMVDDRNVYMAQKADSYFNEGKKVFFVVGAAHVCGDGGIIELLKDMGYTAERV